MRSHRRNLRRFNESADLTAEDIAAIQASRESGPVLAERYKIGLTLVSYIRRKVGRFRDNYQRKPAGAKPVARTQLTCPVCLQASFSGATTAWLDAYVHRCPHGEPCRATGKRMGAACPRCEPSEARP